MSKEIMIPCPHCDKECIKANEIPKSLSRKRGFTGKFGLYLDKGGIVILDETCPNCGKKYKEKKFDHKKRLESWELPRIIELNIKKGEG